MLIAGHASHVRMASMILGWTLNDVTTAMGLGTTDHLHHLRRDALKEALRDLVQAIKGGVDLGEDIEVWHMAQQDSYIDLHDPVVLGAPIVFGGRVPEVLWYLAPNEHVHGFPSDTMLSGLLRLQSTIASTGTGVLPAPTVHLSGWHADAEPLAALVGLIES